MRRDRLFPWALPLLPLLSGCGGGNTASELVKAPEFNPEGQTKCSVGASQQKPLIVEWPAADRGALEAQKNKGLVAVRYRGCEMEVLRQCIGPGSYGYVPVTPKQDTIRIRNEDELYATIPVYAAKFEGKLRTAGELHVDMTIVGSYEAGQHGLGRSDFEGDCAKATHYISALTAGSFEFATGGSADVGAGVDVAGVGAGAKSSAEREVLNRDGYRKACQEASGEDTEPPEGCGALLRVEVVALKKGSPTEPGGDGGEPGEPAPAGDDEPVALGPGVVKVHIDNQDPEELVQLIRFGPAVATQVPVQQQGGGTTMTTVMMPTRELVCTAPCDSWVDGRKGQQFVISGDGVADSETFRLHQREGDLTIQVDPGSAAALSWGVLATSTGIAGAVTGPVFLILGATIGQPDPDVEYDTDTSGIWYGVGAPFAILGVLGLAVGLPLWATSGTDIEMAGSGSAVPRVASNGNLEWVF